MTSRILSVPPARLEILLGDYQRAVGRRRGQALLMLAIILTVVRLGHEETQREIDYVRRMAHAL